jgi:hypothetical protein
MEENTKKSCDTKPQIVFYLGNFLLQFKKNYV